VRSQPRARPPSGDHDALEGLLLLCLLVGLLLLPRRQRECAGQRRQPAAIPGLVVVVSLAAPVLRGPGVRVGWLATSCLTTTC
jgi:hypothetical protein